MVAVLYTRFMTESFSDTLARIRDNVGLWWNRTWARDAPFTYSYHMINSIGQQVRGKGMALRLTVSHHVEFGPLPTFPRQSLVRDPVETAQDLYIALCRRAHCPHPGVARCPQCPIHDDLREAFGKIIKIASYAMAVSFSAILNAIVDRCNTMNHLGLARTDRESIEASQADNIAVLIRRAYRKRKYEDIMRLGAFSPCFSSRTVTALMLL